MESKYPKPISIANAILFSFMCCVFAYNAYLSITINKDIVLIVLQLSICLLSAAKVITSIIEFFKGGESSTKHLVDAISSLFISVVYVGIIVISIVDLWKEIFDIDTRLTILWLVMLLALGGLLMYNGIRSWKKYKQSRGND